LSQFLLTTGLGLSLPWIISRLLGQKDWRYPGGERKIGEEVELDECAPNRLTKPAFASEPVE
jgi:hypothetical protein